MYEFYIGKASSFYNFGAHHSHLDVYRFTHIRYWCWLLLLVITDFTYLLLISVRQDFTHLSLTRPCHEATR